MLFFEKTIPLHIKILPPGIKLTAYLRGECAEYYEHKVQVGKCDAAMAPDTCEEFSPDQAATFGAYQSYKIEQC
jgi:hypothetical protein